MYEDSDLKPHDVQSLSSLDGVASFFAALGYDTNLRVQQTTAALGIQSESLQRQIRRIERIASQDDGIEPLDVYLFELTSVTVAATQGIARVLRNRLGNYLLVLTDDYDRLDFVLLEKSLPPSTPGKQTQAYVTVRPRILSIERRNPSKVALRVLRRFTNTEIDSDAQYEKLVSAFEISEWSERFFNNRGLFSDYYLNERLRQRPEWKDRPEQAYHVLRNVYQNVRSRASGESTLTSLIEPSLDSLGFAHAQVQGSDKSDSPYYRLSSPQSKDDVIGLCLAYPWGRNLDGRDETRGGEFVAENPGARVVTLLQSGEAPWAIVTNGKVWRLYSAKAHSRSTNYYEIDLLETLAMNDPNEAFRYFWLMFRVDAFVPSPPAEEEGEQKSFLDELLSDSETYAKDLGDRLKERVFEEIFPHLATGFIEHLRYQPPLIGSEQGTLVDVTRQLGLKQEPNETFRRQVFQGTLTLLYRLLFLLYAESRGLLPVNEARGYGQTSLSQLKAEIAEKAKDIRDETDDRLKKAYRIDRTDIYDRLMKLFEVVDQGSREYNVPRYNGGLFMTAPESDDTTPEASNARFLRDNKIPDRCLAMGLDLLARDIDPKRGDLVFVDYKSLGVRQLGSVYEGLLEFTVRIAEEKMAIVKGKKTEEVMPYEYAVKTKRKILKEGRGKNAKERVYQPGEVYLENDKSERKATGSYYTPDHVVKYIVENTVGPVLNEKFEGLRPRFREAQQAHRNQGKRNEGLAKRGLPTEDPDKTVNSFQDVTDQLVDIRILDPAMGSGHFLVEAVDFVCDRILGQEDGFLRAFPWNPVTKFLDDTREEIRAEMERQGVTIDAARLTDVNLLKRHVLKRCIYGVDLNPMATELAKVSLWLDCFTLGAPLSFLDHHLKTGNSLIGTTVQEVQKELAAKENETISLFGGPFQGLLSATAAIEELRRIPDATTEQSRQSRSLFAEFETSQAPYKSALDIWVSKHFGNALAEQYLTLAGHDLIDQIKSGGTGLSTEYQDAITKATAIARDKRFFHWDLEFPEAFVDLKRQDWKPKDEQGFDAVVGNPPYLKEYTDRQPFQDFRGGNLAAYYQGKMDIWYAFGCLALDMLVDGGVHSFIGTANWVTSSGARLFRTKISEDAAIRSFIDFGDYKVFEDAGIQTMVYVLQKKRARHSQPIAYTRISVGNLDVSTISGILSNRENSSRHAVRYKASAGGEHGSILTFVDQHDAKLLNHIAEVANYSLQPHDVAMGIIAPQDIVIDKHIAPLSNAGVNAGDGIFILSEDEFRLMSFSTLEKHIIKPFYTSSELPRHFSAHTNKYWVIYTDLPVVRNIDKYPTIKRHLFKYRSIITSHNGPYGLHRARNERFFVGEKIISMRKTSMPHFVYSDNPAYVSQTFFVLQPDDIDLKYLTAVLNSNVCFFWLDKKGKKQGNALQVDKEPLLRIPIRRLDERMDQE